MVGLNMAGALSMATLTILGRLIELFPGQLGLRHDSRVTVAAWRFRSED